ncbi:MAG: hypothetical protein ACM3SS_05265 [Rhodospirillaceae bacterium]
MANTPTRSDVDYDDELAYWRENYAQEPYYRPDYTFEHYEIAYRVGAEARQRHRGRSFDEVEDELRTEYERTRGDSPLTWEEGRGAVRAAWNRLDRMFPDSD